MAEEKKFKDEKTIFEISLEGKSKATMKSYRTQYRRLLEYLDGKLVNETGEQEILDAINKNVENINTKQALINIAIMMKRLYDIEPDYLTTIREQHKQDLKEHVKNQNKKIEELPTYEDLEEFTDYLYTIEKFGDFIINYLLINYFVRNEDLDINIIDKFNTSKENTDLNYLWLDKKKKKVVYIRNKYKTGKTYGQKKHVITDPKFYSAVKQLGQDKLIPYSDNVGYYIKKATFQELGEGKYFKIAVLKFKGDLQKIKQMGDLRGTNVETIINSYDIENI